ncbi:hypothetical protein MGA447_2718 [Enterococcus faecalis]|nr:hypothetical protein MGA447_2718 [Enterococcus faecalis]OSH34133.1 hypothetical protein XJ76305_2745 [Enterococcus faecalis]
MFSSTYPRKVPITGLGKGLVSEDISNKYNGLFCLIEREK